MHVFARGRRSDSKYSQSYALEHEHMEHCSIAGMCHALLGGGRNAGVSTSMYRYMYMYIGNTLTTFNSRL